MEKSEINTLRDGSLLSLNPSSNTQITQIEIEEKINQVKNLMGAIGEEPSFLEQLFISNKKIEAQVIREQRIIISKGMGSLFSSLINSTNITLKEDESKKGLTLCANSIAAAHVLNRNLQRLFEDTNPEFMKDFLRTKQSIEEQRDFLGDSLADKLIMDAQDRMLRRMDTFHNQSLTHREKLDQVLNYILSTSMPK